MRRWVVLFIALMLMLPASVGLAASTSESVSKVTTVFSEFFQLATDYQAKELVIHSREGVRMETIPLPMSGITASSKTFTMKGTNRHAFSFKAQGGTNVSVYIKNQGGTIVKRLVNLPWSGGTVTTLWDGKMDNGMYVKDGNYNIVATVVSGKGSFSKTFEFKVFDKIAPSIKLMNPTQYFSPIISEKIMIPN